MGWSVKVLPCLVIVLLCCGTVYGKGRVMPWMCLERCGDNATQILEQIEQLATYKDLISAVSVEIYNLGPNSTLEIVPLSRVHKTLQAMGFETYAMISSYPYPPEFIEWMRALFANPEPFFEACATAAIQEGFTGFNVDFEPHTGATPEDAKAYAAFLTKFADRMHAIGKKVTVDVATWSPIWDFDALSKTSVDRVITMGTYTANFTSWTNQFNRALQYFKTSQLGIGLQTIIESPNDLEPRFKAIMSAKIEEIDIWRTPVPDSWWPYIYKFVHSK